MIVLEDFCYKCSPIVLTYEADNRRPVSIRISPYIYKRGKEWVIASDNIYYNPFLLNKNNLQFERQPIVISDPLFVKRLSEFLSNTTFYSLNEVQETLEKYINNFNTKAKLCTH